MELFKFFNKKEKEDSPESGEENEGKGLLRRKFLKDSAITLAGLSVSAPVVGHLLSKEQKKLGDKGEAFSEEELAEIERIENSTIIEPNTKTENIIKERSEKIEMPSDLKAWHSNIESLDKTLEMIWKKYWREITGITYAVNYQEKEVKKNWDSINITKEEILAVIAAESGGDPGAESGVGALGLMQVKPSTAAEISGKEYDKLSEEERAELIDDLKNPSKNIAYGATYLRQLKNRFKNEYIAYAAYNIGPTDISKKIRSGNFDPEAAKELKYVKKINFSLENCLSVKA